MYGMDHGVWMFGGWAVMLVLWVLPFALLYVAIKYLPGGFGPAGARKSALDILDEAYARREIDRDEYLQKRDDLRKK